MIPKAVKDWLDENGHGDHPLISLFGKQTTKSIQGCLGRLQRLATELGNWAETQGHEKARRFVKTLGPRMVTKSEKLQGLLQLIV